MTYVRINASKLGGASITAGVGLKLPENLGLHWKTLQETLLRDLANLDIRVVLAFDELPLMLDAIKRREDGATGESLIMELLDALRAARQENTELRMIYTGSLGLHHVLTVLREQGYQNDPANDMALIDLEPLTLENATELARRLLHGENISCDEPEAVAAHLAQTTDGIAYYIQHIVAEMGLSEELTEGIDPEKIERDSEMVRKVLALVGLDHYTTVEEMKYRFRSPFILRIWRNRRGMGE